MNDLAALLFLLLKKTGELGERSGSVHVLKP